MEKVRKSDSEWQAELSAEQFDVCRGKGTERPFLGKYNACKVSGTYVCSCCGHPVFSSKCKFDSGTGWPSFTAPIADDAVAEKPDVSLFIQRTEVICARCEAHLGHVFDDGPAPNGLRYCINSVSLDLKPDGDAEEIG